MGIFPLLQKQQRISQPQNVHILIDANAIRSIREEMGDKMFVGAGTVTTPELVQLAADAGATYIISPDTDEEVIRATRKLGLGVDINEELVLEENKTPHNWKNPVWHHPDGSVAEW